MLEATRRWNEQTSHRGEQGSTPSLMNVRTIPGKVAHWKKIRRRHPRTARGRERSRRSATSTRASPCCTHRPNTPRAHVLVMGDDLSNLGACPPPRLRGRARDGAATPGPDLPALASFPRQRAKDGIAPASTRLPGGKGRGSGPDQRRARCRLRALRDCPDRARAPRAYRVAPLAPFAGARVAVLTFLGGRRQTAESSDRGPRFPSRLVRSLRPAPRLTLPVSPDVPSQDLTSISLTTTERPRKRANRLTLCSLGTSTFARSSATGASP
jgi:hypothetical protein